MLENNVSKVQDSMKIFQLFPQKSNAGYSITDEKRDLIPVSVSRGHSPQPFHFPTLGAAALSPHVFTPEGSRKSGSHCSICYEASPGSGLYCCLPHTQSGFLTLMGSRVVAAVLLVTFAWAS